MFKILAALFAGPGGVITEWFTSMAGKAIGILALLTLLMAGGITAYYSWESTVKYAEDAKYELAAKNAVIKSKDIEIKNLTAIQAQTNQANQNQTTANAAINLNSEAVEAWLKAHPEKDRESSDVLKGTFDKLYGTRK